MDKNKIKNFLTDRFLNEARAETGTPGISVTKAVQKQEDKINKDGLKAVEKNIKDADTVTSTSKSEPVLYNYNSKKEKDYHEQMEILNGTEMNEYDREPNDLFKEKAKEGIEGSSRMGNRADKDTANTTAAWGASSDSFGKDLVKRIKASTKKREDAYDRIISFGDDIETVPKGQKPMAKHSALKEGRHIYEYNPYGSEEENDFNNDQKNKDPKEIKEYSSDYEMGKWVPPSDEHKKLMDKAVKDSGDREDAERAKRKAERKESLKEMDEGSFTAWCKNNGFKDGPSEACARKAMGGDKSSAIHKKATFYMNTVQPNGDTTKDLEENNNNKKPLIKEHHKVMAFLNQHGPDKTAGALIRKELTDYGLDIYEQPMYLHNQIFTNGQENISMMLSDGNIEKAVQEAGAIASQIYDQISENNNNKKPQIKESMKRLKFNKLFDGVGNALKMIPESYRTDMKVFEMTDGNESYKIRWEGTLTEGRAIVLMASDKTMINEDMAHMKHLMGYKSQDTLGTVKGKARLDENAVFNDIWAKTKVLIEAEDIEGKKAPKGEWEKIDKKAPEATKDIEGTTSDDKGTKAPKPKNGEWEKAAVPQAKEAKKDVEGSVAKEIGMGLGEKAPEGEWEDINMEGKTASEPSKTAYAKAPATGLWDEINVPHAEDAKKHITMKEGLQIGGMTFKPITFVIKENDGAKKKVNELVDDVDYGSSKVELAYKKGKISKEKYDELMSKKGQFAEESVNEEEKPYNPIEKAHAEYESPADKKFKSDEWVKAQKDAKGK